MELYSLYQEVVVGVAFFNGDSFTTRLISLLSAFGVWLGLFILQGFALRAMAKKRGIKNLALAFIPFANILLIGKIAGDCNIFGQKVKRAGLYTMLAQIVFTLLYGLMTAAELYLYAVHGAPSRIQVTEFHYIYDWQGLTGFSYVAQKFIDVGTLIGGIVQLIYTILAFVLVMGVYKRYAPRKIMLLSILELFIPGTRFIAFFVLKNREPFDYEGYMRARHEAYMRQYHQQYGNPYGNPYANPYNRNPYQGTQPQSPQRPPEDPFGEFASNGKSSGKTDAETDNENSNGPDEFFN